MYFRISVTALLIRIASEIPVRIPVTSIKLLDRSIEFPISDREISFQGQCRLSDRQRGRLS
jgi:hypothetical protein